VLTRTDEFRSTRYQMNVPFKAVAAVTISENREIDGSLELRSLVSSHEKHAQGNRADDHDKIVTLLLLWM
jgi:hypothetical protein